LRGRVVAVLPSCAADRFFCGGGAAIVRCRSFFFWCLEAQGVGILVCGVSDRVNASAGA